MESSVLGLLHVLTGRDYWPVCGGIAVLSAAIATVRCRRSRGLPGLPRKGRGAWVRAGR